MNNKKIITQAAIEAGARALRDHYQWTWMNLNCIEVSGKVLSAALEHLQPQPPTPTDDEVERVAREMFIEYHGQIESTFGPSHWIAVHPRGREVWCAVARAAMREMQDRKWGVYYRRSNERVRSVNGISLGPTTDREYLVSVVQGIGLGNDYEVRPYDAEGGANAKQN